MLVLWPTSDIKPLKGREICFAYSFSGLVFLAIMVETMVAGNHDTWVVDGSLCPYPKTGGRELIENTVGFWKLKAHPPVTCILQQDHAS